MMKVAGYCRVSTDKQDQINSFVSQKTFFREYIARNSDWELYEVYADEGVSGTSTHKRTQFNRMIQDAYEKKFRMIITKEVSRFSRNILDTIAYTRELKALGIGVIFMNDGLNTLEPDAELRLSIMGSIAQEESRKTSERVKWGQSRQMERGVVFGHSMLGYDVAGGKLTINPEGAETVKRIFRQYGIEKKSTTAIAGELRDSGVKTAGGNSHWSETYIIKILKNEKYVGDLVQKKTVTPDYLTHSKKYNHGEEELIVIRDHHEPIISRELWELVQKEIVSRRRTRSFSFCSRRYLFSGKIVCGECGSAFVSRIKTRSNGTSYRRWGCSRASKEGKEKMDASGNIVGCNVGRQVRDDLARDMLRFVIGDLKLDRKLLSEKIAEIAEIGMTSRGSSVPELSEIREKKQALIKKIDRVLDAYLTEVISKEEMIRLKQNYSKDLETIEKQLEVATNNRDEEMKTDTEKMRKVVIKLLNNETDSEEFLRHLLEYMKVYRDGTILIKLNHLDCVWKFRLVKAT